MSDNRQPKTAATGASLQSVDTRKQLSAWAANHQLVAVETLIRLLANPLGSLLTWMVIAIALTLPGALWMALDNMEQLSGRFQESGRITLYLLPGTEVEQAQQLERRIQTLDSVSSTELIDADMALDDFRANSGLQAALEFLPENPLPSVILVEPPLGVSQQQLSVLVGKLQNYQLVDSVQLDMAWVERLLAMLALAERLIWVLGLLLALAILLVVGNTIRLAIAARVDEIRVVKLVGGTNAWVRRPFLYTGLWYGMVGGLLAWLMLIICWLLLNGPVSNLADLYGSGFELKPLSATAALSLLLSAMLLGWLGAWWSVSRHLDQIEP
ncbi:permease-like cell division protein FtsX [Thalassolituus marinus]|uniref:Cell division protein FtsX n=1 Tax=Thalassolituus marinus TaxID=671053 RepID=A0ABS7ZL12_9GAMM|nr:permease-like cell division protein FtsX [Thalassolituus marinus]MCA6062414.1 ABC transporter permease [Thalassolituus marinus]